MDQASRMAKHKFTAERAPANFKTVMVDVEKLDKAWSGGKEWVGEGAEIAGRRAKFKEWMENNPDKPIQTTQIGGIEQRLVYDADGKPVRLPNGTYQTVQVPVFSDGRHRFSVLRDEGMKEVPVSVPEEIADEFARLFGAR